MRTLRIGTRGSALARIQASTVANALQQRYPELKTTLVELSTAGDREPSAPLERMESIGWFTSTLETALVDRAIDLAVHSYKDLPARDDPTLVVAATLARSAAEDVLCAGPGVSLDSLPPGARVGTSSLRRLAQLRLFRRDLSYLPLRGNVPTRLGRIRRGELDAVVVARAGLQRLNLTAEISEIFPVDRLLPAPGQGALAIQTRADDHPVRRILEELDHPGVHASVRAERLVMAALLGGCSAPVGAHVWQTETGFTLLAGVFSSDGGASLRVRLEGPDPEALGREAALQLHRGGALKILSRSGRIDRPQEIEA